MAEPESPPAAPQPEGGLQFDKAEYAPDAPGAAATCLTCQSPITREYFGLGDKMVCPKCRVVLSDLQAGSSPPGRFFGALGFGVLGGIGGAVVWFAIRALTNYELSLIAILVGWLVGKGVHRGCRGKGGWLYQTMAIVLTYTAIAATYVPLVKAELDKSSSKPAVIAPAAPAPAAEEPGTANSPVVVAPAVDVPAVDGPGSMERAEEPVRLPQWLLWCIAVILSFAAPFGNIIGVVIVGIGLWEAWRHNKRVVLEFTGPFRLAEAPVSEAAAAPPGDQVG
ncbi:MAG: hypothetical protein ACYC8T_36080 [Myxococcaceae bacterium]